MKKILTLALSLMLLLAAACAAEAPASTQVFVSLTDDTGALVLALEPVDVTDADGDGVLTISDALQLAHVARHPDGGAAYATEETEFGLSLVRLWGVENGGSYGYYLNNASAWSLLDPVRPGDHVKAYAFTDLTAWSDTYCYFDADVVEAELGAELPLTLYAAGFDAEWNPVAMPVEGAVITVDGQPTEWVTDAEGKVVFTCAEAGEYLISASSETLNLVTPVCVVIVK